MPGKLHNLPVRIVTAILYGTVLIGSLLIHPALFALIMLVFSILAGYEFIQLTLSRNNTLSLLYYTVFSTIIFAVHFFLFFGLPAYQIIDFFKIWMSVAFVLLIAGFTMSGVVDVLSNRSHNLDYLFITFFAFFYITLPLLLLSIIPYIHFGGETPEVNKSLVIFLFAVIWTYDTMAYFIGSLWGKRKLAPTISPAKTWEGAIGGGILTFVIFAIIRIFFFKEFDIVWYGIALGLIMICATFGDLFESRIKRRAGVKDSGTIFPGHGGALDRIDSVLFAAPIYFSLLILLQVLN